MVNDRSSRTLGLRGLVLVGFILAAALSRLIPHPPNFTPVGAMALFGGAYFASRFAAIAVPIAAMLLSDLVLAATHGWALGWMTLVIYACIAASAVLGMTMRARASAFRITQRSLFSALLFFVVTNFAVWAMGRSTPYRAPLPGLLELARRDLLRPPPLQATGFRVETRSWPVRKRHFPPGVCPQRANSAP